MSDKAHCAMTKMDRKQLGQNLQCEKDFAKNKWRILPSSVDVDMYD